MKINWIRLQLYIGNIKKSPPDAWITVLNPLFAVVFEEFRKDWLPWKIECEAHKGGLID